MKTGARLLNWAESGPDGYVGAESGFITARDPDTIRAPDVSYVRAERIPEDVPEGFWELAPDLAVEVVSPGDTAVEVREKVREYLAAGVPMVWVMYPGTREVIVHTADGLARAYGPDDVLEGLDLLPGFRCRVAELFD